MTKRVLLFLFLALPLWPQCGPYMRLTPMPGGGMACVVVEAPPSRTGTGSPVDRDSCQTLGETYFQSDALPGDNIFACTTTGAAGVAVWSLQSGGVSFPTSARVIGTNLSGLPIAATVAVDYATPSPTGAGVSSGMTSTVDAAGGWSTPIQENCSQSLSPAGATQDLAISATCRKKLYTIVPSQNLTLTVSGTPIGEGQMIGIEYDPPSPGGYTLTLPATFARYGSVDTTAGAHNLLWFRWDGSNWLASAPPQITEGGSPGVLPVGSSYWILYPIPSATDTFLTANAPGHGQGANRTVECSFDGGGSAIATNAICYKRIPVAGTITGWAIEAVGSSPGCTIDVLKIASGATLPTASITASATPTLTSTDNAVASTAVSTWCSGDPNCLSLNDIVAFKVTTPGNATWAHISLSYTVN